MKFTDFENIVKTRYPEIELYPHGSGHNSVSVRIQFRPGGKSYDYNGSYVYVLNKLGILSVYRHDYEETKKILANYISNNGKPNIFSDKPMDYSRQITDYTDLVHRYETMYLIID